MQSLIPSLKDSIFNSSADSLMDLTEFSLDSIIGMNYIDAELIKDFPIVKSIYGVGKADVNLYERNLLKQILIFIQEFNNGTISKGKLDI